MADKTEREQFEEVITAVEDAGFEITFERFKNDREDDEFCVEFWLRYDGAEP